jgi:arsenite methyltransferase
VADIVATAPLPDEVKGDWSAYTGCMAGASQISELEEMMRDAGCQEITIAPKDTSRSFIREWLPGKRVEDYLGSGTIEATRPGLIGR